MRHAKLARRYAEALGELALENNALDRVEEELLAFRELLRTIDGLRSVIEDPKIEVKAKQNLVRTVLATSLSASRITQNFLLLVIAKRREAYIEEMIDAYIEYANKKRGVVQVELTAAHPLTEEQKAAVSAKLEQVLGKGVRLSVREDPDILGGLIARVGDLVMDGSVATRLARLKEALQRARLN